MKMGLVREVASLSRGTAATSAFVEAFIHLIGGGRDYEPDIVVQTKKNFLHFQLPNTVLCKLQVLGRVIIGDCVAIRIGICGF